MISRETGAPRVRESPVMIVFYVRMPHSSHTVHCNVILCTMDVRMYLWCHTQFPNFICLTQEKRPHKNSTKRPRLASILLKWCEHRFGYFASLCIIQMSIENHLIFGAQTIPANDPSDLSLTPQVRPRPLLPKLPNPRHWTPPRVFINIFTEGITVFLPPSVELRALMAHMQGATSCLRYM